MFSAASVNEMPWLIRADFTDQDVWENVRQQVLVDPDLPGEDPQVGFVEVEEPVHEGLTAARLLELEPHRLGTYFIFDSDTVTHPGRPLVAVDANSQPGTFFRLVPSTVQSFAVNMMLSNMDFDDFADNVDADGIFRGFHDSARPGPDRDVDSAAPPHLARRPEPPVTSAGSTHTSSDALTFNVPGTIENFIREAAPDDPGSFVGQLIRERRWDSASWVVMESGMRAACRRYDNSEDVPRRLTAAFHSVMVRVPNLVAAPGFLGLHPDQLPARLERIRVLSTWFFNGWSMQRPDGPVPGDEPGPPPG